MKTCRCQSHHREDYSFASKLISATVVFTVEARRASTDHFNARTPTDNQEATMGWGRMFLLGNIGQQMDIEEVKNYLDRAIEEINKGEAVDADQNRAIEQLRTQNRELQLYVLALVRLLTQKGVVTETEITRLVEAVENSGKKG